MDDVSRPAIGFGHLPNAAVHVGLALLLACSCCCHCCLLVKAKATIIPIVADNVVNDRDIGAVCRKGKLLLSGASYLLKKASWLPFMNLIVAAHELHH